MPFSTLAVGAAVTPTIIETYIAHYLKRRPLRQKPTAHLSYHEGLALVRRFLEFASHQTVDDVQLFTAQWVPTPTWIRTEDAIIPIDSIDKAADAIITQLGPQGLEDVGGFKWWQWRDGEPDLKAEWIEMKDLHNERKRSGQKCKRVMLYVHGGAYFFGSVDEHRYQMQRHARKLRARVFAPRYRLAPQFPFPCGLLDCLAAYLYLLTVQDPSEIVLAGDSAGGGMVLSMLCILRDQGLPLPAGAILISPWVDLTHSFPSVAGNDDRDYIPAHGFMQKPSASWPPPNEAEMAALAKVNNPDQIVEKVVHLFSVDHERASQERPQSFAVVTPVISGNPADQVDPMESAIVLTSPPETNPIPRRDANLTVLVDENIVEITEQIQMYAPNHLLAHPLVSPALQPSLGGLPPLLVLTGGGEMLRDEQIYVAHKAANPTAYPLSEALRTEKSDELLHKYKPTNVQLQVWDDLCHVPPTLSFTRPAKYMYRSIAQFGAWALARAQQTEIDIIDDDAISFISTATSSGDEDEKLSAKVDKEPVALDSQLAEVGKAGDPLPHFKSHMIRQRVDRHGRIFPLAPPESLPACQMELKEVGCIKAGPVRKWLAARKEWDAKYSYVKKNVQKQRMKEMAIGYMSFGDGEKPPPCALAGRRVVGVEERRKKKAKRNWGISMWSGWGNKHDERTIQREEEATGRADVTVNSGSPGRTDDNGVPTIVTTETTSRGRGDSLKKQGRGVSKSATRGNSRRVTVTDAGQTREDLGLAAGDAAVGPVAGEAITQEKPDIEAQPESDATPAIKPLPHKLVEQLKGTEGARNPSTNALVAAEGVTAPVDVLAAHSAFSSGLPSPSSATGSNYIDSEQSRLGSDNASTKAMIDTASLAARRTSEDNLSRYDTTSLRSFGPGTSISSRPFMMSNYDQTRSDNDQVTLYSRLDAASVLSASRPTTPSSTVAIFAGRERAPGVDGGARPASPDSKISHVAVRHADGIMHADSSTDNRVEDGDSEKSIVPGQSGFRHNEAPISDDAGPLLAQSHIAAVGMDGINGDSNLLTVKPDMHRNVSTEAVMHAEGVIDQHDHDEADAGASDAETEKGFAHGVTAALTSVAATIGITNNHKADKSEEEEDLVAAADEPETASINPEPETPAALAIDEPEILSGKVYNPGEKRPEMPPRFQTAMETLE